MKNKKITIEIPFLKSFDDYHEIKVFGKELNSIIKNQKICCEEIAMNTNDYPICTHGFNGYVINGKYWGLFYLENNNPTNEIVSKLIEKVIGKVN